jgi:spermidine/putrescine transport system permease protein
VTGLARRRRLLPYALLAPGLAWLALFFLIPLGYMLDVSLQQGDIETGFERTFHFGVFADAVSQYGEQLARSFLYAGLATLIALAVGFPLAYFIAFRGGRWRSALLLLVILPFFITYLVRTLSWQTILSDGGLIVSALKTVGVLGEDGRLLATTSAVVAGITYNFLPFMILPIYASLEQIDRRVLEAAGDLYGRRRDTLARVVVPMAMPGIVAGVLLTFIPAAGDFINAELLGTPRQFMIGNVIQSRFLEITDYPTAAALSFILMAIILVMVAAYARMVGTEALTGAEAGRR